MQTVADSGQAVKASNTTTNNNKNNSSSLQGLPVEHSFLILIFKYSVTSAKPAEDD